MRDRPTDCLAFNIIVRRPASHDAFLTFRSIHVRVSDSVCVFFSLSESISG
jgi:hypothetical protein